MDQENQPRISYFYLFSYLAGLGILINTPSSWRFGLPGGSNWYIGVLVLLAIVWVGGVGLYLGRQGWISSWLWWAWLLTIISIPILVIVLDSTQGDVIRYIAWPWFVIFFMYLIIKEATRKLVKATSILVIFLLPFIIILLINLNTLSGIGRCHLFSELRNRGCIRSIKMIQGGPLFYAHPELDGGAEKIIWSVDSAVFIEPINPWQALVNSKEIEFEDKIDHLFLTSDGTRIHAFTMMFLPGSLNWVSSDSLLINLPSGEIVDQFHLGSHDPELVSAYLAEQAAEVTREVEPSEPKITTYSENGSFLSVVRYDDGVSVWQNIDGLKHPLDIVIDPIDSEQPVFFQPDGEPYWSFISDTAYSCTSFSTDGSLMAGYGEEVVDIYDVVERRQIHSLSLTTSACPTFSAENQFFTLIKEFGRDELTIFEVGSGQAVARVQIEGFRISSIDFSANDSYMIVSNDNFISGGMGLIFEVDKLIRG